MDGAITTQNRQSNTNRRWRWLIITVAVCGLGIVVYVLSSDTRWHIRPKQWAVVEDGYIYRSGRLSRYLIRRMLEKHEIDIVIDLSNPRPGDLDYDVEMQVVRDLGLQYHHFTLPGDGVGDIEQYFKALKTLVEARQQDQRVWVHCRSGVNRTGATVAFYRMLFEGKPAQQVYEEYAGFMWNPHKTEKLVEYINDNMRLLAERFVDEGLLNSMPERLPTFQMVSMD